VASLLSLIGITLGTLYQKRYCGGIDWRTGNLTQCIGAGLLFAAGAFAFETREIRWSGELIFALVWLVLVLSIAAVGLMYWLIRRSAATGFASLFYLVPAVTAIFAFILFGERLDALSVLGMVICAAACCWPIRAPQSLASFNCTAARPCPTTLLKEANVRSWHVVDILTCTANVRFWG
jgi:drug/metabolite transporter (DMT)-like permease